MHCHVCRINIHCLVKSFRPIHDFVLSMIQCIFLQQIWNASMCLSCEEKTCVVIFYSNTDFHGIWMQHWRDVDFAKIEFEIPSEVLSTITFCFALSSPFRRSYPISSSMGIYDIVDVKTPTIVALSEVAPEVAIGGSSSSTSSHSWSSVDSPNMLDSSKVTSRDVIIFLATEFQRRYWCVPSYSNSRHLTAF